MAGLLLKDYYNLKSQLKMLGLFLILFLVLAISMKNSGFFAGIAMMLAVMMPVTALAYDERAKWDQFAVTMPVTRTQIVGSKYLLGILFMAGSCILSTIIAYIIEKFSFSDTFQFFCIFFSIGTIIQAILLPLMFQFGTEKGRFILIGVIGIPVIIVALLIQPGFQIDFHLISLLLKVAPIIAIFIYVFYLFVSITIYRKKEL